MKLDGIHKHTVRIGGKLSFHNFPAEVQGAIISRLAEKDPMMKDSLNRGILPGIKINGKEVTKDNIHEFEIKPMKAGSKKLETIVEGTTPNKKTYTKKELDAMEFKELKVVGKKLGTTDRSKKKLIKEILALQ